ncbi:unknown protein [Microcystis aeruginosa NIES-843]|uniref:Uncharacterized protein n=1 Tax=Microcystis aeruginosa (strain NIES-843 / IAM M-2473) TaxID=449447 RepID=B0JIR7_MICAN|nr:unknown protein [Microcystis aeruginosa NIES-843]
MLYETQTVYRSRPVGAKHSDRKSTVSAISYCPNASPVLFQQVLAILGGLTPN